MSTKSWDLSSLLQNLPDVEEQQQANQGKNLPVTINNPQISADGFTKMLLSSNTFFS